MGRRGSGRNSRTVRLLCHVRPCGAVSLLPQSGVPVISAFLIRTEPASDPRTLSDGAFMTTTELMADVLAQNLEVVKSTLADFSDADMLVRPAPAANHAAWQLG